jgi:hypothetical protein
MAQRLQIYNLNMKQLAVVSLHLFILTRPPVLTWGNASAAPVIASAAHVNKFGQNNCREDQNYIWIVISLSKFGRQELPRFLDQSKEVGHQDLRVYTLPRLAKSVIWAPIGTVTRNALSIMTHIVLPPFQNIDHFDKSKCLDLTMHLYILYLDL